MDQFLSHMQLLTYSSLMPFRLGLSVRNINQLFTVTGGFVGMENLARGITRAFTKEGQLASKAAGLMTLKVGMPLEDLLPQRITKGLDPHTTAWLREQLVRFKKGDTFQEPEEFATTSGLGKFVGAADRKLVNLVKGAYDVGMTMSGFRPIENYVNRHVAYNTGISAMEHYGKQFLDSKITLPEMMNKTGLSYMDKPVQDMVLQHLIGENGLKQAGLVYGQNLMEGTHWLYDVGNSPEIFRTKLGRLFGQFGVWPTNYIQYVRKGVTNGNAQSRTAFITRWIAANAAVTAVGQELLGVNITPWTWMSPLMYTGGPALDMFFAIRQKLRETDQPGMNFGQASLSSLANLIPGRMAWRDWQKAFAEEEFSEAVKRAFGFRTKD
jgi:hypothetical protein